MDAKDRGDFKAELNLRDIRCFTCNGTRLDHGPLGECYKLRRQYMPYSLRLSYTADEGLLR